MPLSEPPLELDALHSLLPSNATQLERDLLKLVPYDSVLQEAVSQMNAIGLTVFPDDWKIWILQQRGQLPLLEAIGDIDNVLENSLYLLENRGTLAAVIRVCRMLGYKYASVWEHEWPTIHFSEFQVALYSNVASQDHLVRLEKAIKFVKPARCRLRRMYSGYDFDVRSCILSRNVGKQTGVLSRQYLGHFSGYPSRHNPQLWIAFYQVNTREVSFLTDGGIQPTLTGFPFALTGSVQGGIIDGEGVDVTGGSTHEQITYTFSSAQE